MTKAEQLLQQAFGVEAMFDFTKKKVDEAKIEMESAKRQRSALGMFEDCGEFYREAYVEAVAKHDTLVNLMVSTEKYMKKLRHGAREISDAA